MILDSNHGGEEEAAGAEAGIQADAEAEPVDAAEGGQAAEAGEPQAEAQDAEPQAAPEGTEKAGDDAPLAPDLMDIFESEEMVEPTVVIPGLQNLTMSEVASETERVLEEIRSQFLS